MKIIYTSPIFEHPPIGGPFLRVENSVIALNKICELHLVIFKEIKEIGGSKAIEFFKQNCYKIVTSEDINYINKLKKYPKFLRKFILKKNYFKKSNCDYLVEYCKKNKIDIVWFGYGNISFELMKEFKKKLPEIPIVCDTDSVWSRFVLRKIPFIKDIDEIKKIEIEGKNKEIEEKLRVEFAEVTTAVSQVDADYYQSLTENKKKLKCEISSNNKIGESDEYQIIYESYLKAKQKEGSNKTYKRLLKNIDENLKKIFENNKS